MEKWSPSEVAPDSLLSPISTASFLPWRHLDGQSHQPLLKPSKLMQASSLCDYRMDVDCVSVSYLGQGTFVHQPWLAIVQPSLLDQLPETNSFSFYSALGRDICQLLDERLGLPPASERK